ncbi:glycosyltransferase [Gordonia bronchialis]|uniref:glycosyltransferase family 2 protein n=1 Tax=Gordonia bronchialis TaxID=2054 RepID=UPI001CBDAE99|nr:glycosyltransferase family 2 protein [Gordonia bronchialis]UAK40187.1 glycosyltransferase [Gordonia bronchialis]
MGTTRLACARVTALLVVVCGLVYIGWRWTDSIAWHAWWIAIPLVIAETYSFSESALFAFMTWRSRRRPTPPGPDPGATVDVFITTYNEPIQMVMQTAVAARDMRHPHRTWILDDGNRPEFAAAARRIGVGYIRRGPDWDGRHKFAKAGNVNNALFQTQGEFVAILDADQVPHPEFLVRVLGYFTDPQVAFVQTPQSFWNVPDSDPLGCQAELFYGPIQQGKDGWGAAFFCGSNAVLRREALMALGVARYSANVERLARGALSRAQSRLVAERDQASNPHVSSALNDAVEAIAMAREQIEDGAILGEVSYALHNCFDEIADLYALWPDTRALLDDIVESVEVSRIDQAMVVQPVDTSTVTEDMATAMHLHALGWRSAYHHEVLVHGLAPEDVRTMLGQRHRWAAGSMQVFFADNPLFCRGLSVAQRLMYLATMTSYLSGFAALVYIAAPIIFLTTGVFPMDTMPVEFFGHFLPFFVACQLLYLITGFGHRGMWRGQQYSFALFPTWIAAAVSAAATVFFGRKLEFSVTGKEGGSRRADYRAVWPQIAVMIVLAGAVGVGVWRAVYGEAPLLPTYLTVCWVVVDLLLLSVALRAARCRPADKAPPYRIISPSVYQEVPCPHPR